MDVVELLEADVLSVTADQRKLLKHNNMAHLPDNSAQAIVQIIENQSLTQDLRDQFVGSLADIAVQPENQEPVLSAVQAIHFVVNLIPSSAGRAVYFSQVGMANKGLLAVHDTDRAQREAPKAYRLGLGT